MGQVGTTRDNEDHLTPSSTSQIDFYSSHSSTSMATESGKHANSVRACSSAPPSPRSSSAPFHSSSLTNFLNNNAALKKSDVHLKNDAVTSRPNTHETLPKSRSSTDLSSLVSSPVPQATHNPFPRTTLNRSRSYTNIKKASCGASNETEVRPGANNPKSDSDRSTKAELRRKRSSTWTRIPTFEEFRAMHLSGKTASDNRNKNDMSSTCKSSNTIDNNNNNNNNGHVTIPGSSHGQTNETKEASISKNPVIQELLVKYGLNKMTDLTRRPVKNSGVCCSMAAVPVQPDITNSKHKLLSMVDDFLTNKDKKKGLRSSRSTSDVRNCNSLGERRTLSSPRMTAFEKYHMSEARNCLNNDVGRDLESPENLVVRSGRNCGQNEGGTAEESFVCTVEIPDYSSRKVASVACRDGVGNLHRPRKNKADETGDSILKCQTKEKDYPKTSENSGLEKGDGQVTEESISVLQQGEENPLTQQQPEISITISSSEKSTTVASTAPQEFTKMSRKPGEKNRKVSQRRRSSSEIVMKSGRKERRRRGRTVSGESQRENKDDSSGAHVEKMNHSHAVQRTKSLLSLDETVTSYDEPRDLEVLKEFPGGNVSRRGSRNSTRSDGSLNAESDFLAKERPRSSGSGHLSVKSDSDFSRTGSNSSLISRGSSFVSNISTDSGSLHVDFGDSDGDEDVFNGELRVVPKQVESEIKRNDSGLGDEIGVTPRLRKRWEDIVDDSSQRWSVVAASARYWREVTVKKKERNLQEQKCNEGRKLSCGRKISAERSPNAVSFKVWGGEMEGGEGGGEGSMQV